jgi:hypothetical protein
MHWAQMCPTEYLWCNARSVPELIVVFGVMCDELSRQYWNLIIQTLYPLVRGKGGLVVLLGKLFQALPEFSYGLSVALFSFFRRRLKRVCEFDECH